MSEDDRWVAPRKAAEILGCGRSKIFVLIKSGVLVSNTNLGPKSRRISVASISKLMDAAKAEAAE